MVCRYYECQMTFGREKNLSCTPQQAQLLVPLDGPHRPLPSCCLPISLLLFPEAVDKKTGGCLQLLEIPTSWKVWESSPSTDIELDDPRSGLPNLNNWSLLLQSLQRVAWSSTPRAVFYSQPPPHGQSNGSGNDNTLHERMAIPLLQKVELKASLMPSGLWNYWEQPAEELNAFPRW